MKVPRAWRWLVQRPEATHVNFPLQSGKQTKQTNMLLAAGCKADLKHAAQAPNCALHVHPACLTTPSVPPQACSSTADAANGCTGNLGMQGSRRLCSELLLLNECILIQHNTDQHDTIRSKPREER